MSSVQEISSERSRLETGKDETCQTRTENHEGKNRKQRHHNRVRGERKKKRRDSAESRKEEVLDDSSSKHSPIPSVEPPQQLPSSRFEAYQSQTKASTDAILTYSKPTSDQCQLCDVDGSNKPHHDVLTSGTKSRRHKKLSKHMCDDVSEKHYREHRRSRKNTSHRNGSDSKSLLRPHHSDEIESSTQGNMLRLTPPPNQEVDIHPSISSNEGVSQLRVAKTTTTSPDPILSPMSGCKVEKLRRSLECYTTSNVGYKADEMLALVRKAVDEVAAKHEELKLSYISDKSTIHSRERTSNAQHRSLSPKRQTKAQTQSSQSVGCDSISKGDLQELDQEWESEMSSLFQKWGLQRRPSQRHVERVLTHSASFRIQRETKTRALAARIAEKSHPLITKRSTSLVCDIDGHVIKEWPIRTNESKKLGRRDPRINAYVSPGA